MILVAKRTFEARRFAKGGKKRLVLNQSLLTSDRYPQYPWLFRRPFLDANQQPHERFPHLDTPYRTKRLALAEAARYTKENPCPRPSNVS